MINLPAAPAVPVSTPAGAAGLPPPAGHGAATAPAASDGSARAAVPGSLGDALLDAAVAAAPAPFGALLNAMADIAAEEGSVAEDAPQDVAADSTAAAQAVATLLPSFAAFAPAHATPGATPDSVAAVAAALTAPVSAAAAGGTAPAPAPAPVSAGPVTTGGDQAQLLRQQAQATLLAAAARPAAAPSAAEAGSAEVRADAARAHEPSLLDARAALLASARPLPAMAANPAPAERPGTGAALPAALAALQGQAADSTAAPIAAKDGASLLTDSQRQGDGSALPGFRSVLANTVAAPAAPAADRLQLSGNPEQWQQPLRAALGDRLQLQLARNDERAVIRLEPPNMGSVEISVRHSGGALHVNIAASHSEVVRQLNTIGDAVRQDLSQRQFSDVAVTVSSSGARNLADSGAGQQRQQEAQQQREQQRQPGRALDEDNAGPTTFAMLSERE
jgi:flagellar hook-length control protein FliK